MACSISLLPLISDVKNQGILEKLGQIAAAGEVRASYSSFDLQALANVTVQEAIRFVKKAEASKLTRYVLISDAIVEAAGNALGPVGWVKEYVAPSTNIVSLAIHPKAKRIVDIDRVIPQDCPVSLLVSVIRALAGKLLYLSRPLEKREVGTVDCRVIRRDAEWGSYFRLRHDVYSVMGYLEPEVVECSSMMELDSCDANSLHFGAFAALDAREVLVGTARIVTNRPPNEKLSERLQQLTKNDPVMRAWLNYELPLQLPVFQSQPAANPVLTEILSRDLVCGELSRVIVCPEYRGAGISTQLVDHAIERGRQTGIERLFLECLKIHVPFYERMGFRIVPGMVGQVLGVQRTMGVMEYDFTARPSKPR